MKKYLAEAKAQRKAERDRTIGRAKQKQVAAPPPHHLHHAPATAPEEAHTRARTHGVRVWERGIRPSDECMHPWRYRAQTTTAVEHRQMRIYKKMIN